MTQDLKPVLDPECLEEFKKILLSRKKWRVLEWGSGYSTIYFPTFMEKNSIDYSWISIESDPKWMKEIGDLIIGKEKIKLIYSPIREKYCREPIGMEKFDLIFVDGVNRKDCLRFAKDYMKSDSIILLHDAQRLEYFKAMTDFKGNYLTKKLWKGNLK